MVKDNKKRELWEKDKNFFQRASINAKLWFMKYQRQTHGMGFMMLLILAVLIIWIFVEIVPAQIQSSIDRQRAERAQKLAECLIAGSCIWGA